MDPGASMTAVVTMTTPTDLATARLVLAVPEGWTVADADGGTLDTGRAQLTWDLGRVPAGATIAHQVRLLAPSASPVDGGPSVESTFAASLEQVGGVTAGPGLTVLVAPRVVVEHRMLARIDPGTLEATYLPIDTPITDQERFETFRVRFQLRNADDLAVSVAPRLEYRPADGHGLPAAAGPRRGPGRAVLRLPGVDADRWDRRDEARAGRGGDRRGVTRRGRP